MTTLLRLGVNHDMQERPGIIGRDFTLNKLGIINQDRNIFSLFVIFFAMIITMQ